MPPACTISFAMTSVATPRAVSPSRPAASRSRFLRTGSGSWSAAALEALYEPGHQVLRSWPLAHRAAGALGHAEDVDRVSHLLGRARGLDKRRRGFPQGAQRQLDIPFGEPAQLDHIPDSQPELIGIFKGGHDRLQDRQLAVRPCVLHGG